MMCVMMMIGVVSVQVTAVDRQLLDRYMANYDDDDDDDDDDNGDDDENDAGAPKPQYCPEAWSTQDVHARYEEETDPEEEESPDSPTAENTNGGELHAALLEVPVRSLVS